MAGFVYFFRHKNTTPVKIGMTESETVESRFISFKTSSPYGGEILGYIHTKTPREVEAKAHKKFNAFRVNGEFFEINQDMIDNFISKHNTCDTKYDFLKTQLDSFLLDDSVPSYEKDILIKKISDSIKIARGMFENVTIEDCPEFIKRILSIYKPTGDSPIYMSNEEIRESDILNDLKIQPRKFGIEMKNAGFNQFIKRVDGKPKRVYELFKVE